MNEKQTFTRFEAAQRIEHVLLLISFTTLCLTGLPQKYATAGISELIIERLQTEPDLYVFSRDERLARIRFGQAHDRAFAADLLHIEALVRQEPPRAVAEPHAVRLEFADGISVELNFTTSKVKSLKPPITN